MTGYGLILMGEEVREILVDEPEWVNVLRVVPIELDGRNVSAN